jgi:polar amino acid transport system substrate-binding protein
MRALIGLLLWFALVPAGADAAAPAPLRVATYECPPFVVAEDAGGYAGLSSALWDGIARDLGLDYRFVERDLVATLEQVAAGAVDIGLSCISITPEREEVLDFSHAFYETHLAIAAREEGVLALVANVFSDPGVLKALGIILGLSAVVGGVFYALEHRWNDKIYSTKTAFGRFVEAVILGLLFITKGPFNYYEFKTLLGRTLNVLIAAGSTLFIASLTAVLASSFTLGRLQTDIRGPDDLAGAVVAAKAGSTSSAFLRDRNVTHRTYAEIAEMLTALDAGALDAVVADAPVLKYEIKRAREQGRLANVTLLPHQFAKQNYALVLPSGSPRKEAVNRALLRFRESPAWRQALIDYLGETP